MPRTQPDYKIPYDADGNMMNYAEPDWSARSPKSKAAEWREAEEFWAELTLVDTIRRPQLIYFVWADEVGHRYPQTYKDLFEMVSDHGIVQGRADGIWRPRKITGGNYSLKFLRS